MSFKISYFMPAKGRDSLHIPLNIEYDKIDKDSNGPFYKYMMDEKSEYTVNRFLDAIKEKSIEDAVVYLSKNYADRIDLTQFKETLAGINGHCSPFVIKAPYDNKGPKNCKMNTVLMVDRKMNKTSIFHIYMLPEPDRFGKWKIYGIEQE